jgi:hypothetical protein
VAAQNEASEVDSLLSRGKASNGLLSPAAGDATHCDSTSLASDVEQIQQVQSQRQTELTDAQNLDTADLQNGGALKSELVVALQDSLAADGAYLSWAESQAIPSTCVNGDPPQNVTADDQQATNDKTTFLGTWRPIAQQYGLQSRGTGDM